MSLRPLFPVSPSPGRRAPIACALVACLSVGIVGCSDGDRDGDAGAGAGTQAGAAAPAQLPTERTETGQAAAANARPAATARVDASWEGRSCELVTAETIATTFELPVGAIEQSNPIGSRCAYEWEGDDRELKVAVRVAEWSEDAAATAEYFERATRSMSAAEVSSAMERVSAAAAEDGKLDTAARTSAASGIAGAVAAGGLSFQPVSGVGDQARFEPASGDLHVRAGNLYFVVNAWLGPDMPLPAEINGQSIMAASKAWMQETAQQRQDAAAALARAAVATL